MSIHKTKAVVLKTVNFGEADKIVTLYTQSYGKLGVIAKGARRINSRFGSSLELGTLIDVLFYGKESSNLSTLTQCNITESFRKIREDFDLLSACFYMISAVNEMTREKQRNGSLFNLLIESLSTLLTIGDIFKSIALFEIKLLKILGYEPNLKQCSACRTEVSDGEVKFSVTKGGVICSSCGKIHNDLVPISLGALRSLEKMRDWDMAKSTRLKLSPSFREEIEKVLYPSIKYHIGKEIKSRNFFKKIESYHLEV